MPARVLSRADVHVLLPVVLTRKATLKRIRALHLSGCEEDSTPRTYPVQTAIALDRHLHGEHLK